MKISTNLYISVGIFATLIAIIGVYAQTEFEIIGEIDHEIHEAEEVVVASLDFNVENFHTQLEAWEYAYEPSQKRLDAFESHKITLDESLEKWETVVLEEEDSSGEPFHALYKDAAMDMREISQNLKIVEADWIFLLAAVGAHYSTVNEGASEAEIKRLDTLAHFAVTQNEDLFDNLEFNKKIDNFVLNQKAHIKSLELQRKIILQSVTGNIFFVTLVFIGFGLVINYFISKQIVTPLKKLENASANMSKGNLDVEIETSGKNEISSLITSFLMMRNSIKDNIEKEKIASLEKIKNERLTAIGEIASRLAHDLRNPLSVISNEIQVIQLRDPNPNEKMQKSQDRIGRAIQRMTHQLEDVMDFVRIKSLDIKEHNMNTLIKSSVKSLVIPSGIKITFPENDCVLSVDSTQISIVINNLIFNSIQAMRDSGGIDIRILENKENIVIEIEDSGPGIPENNLEKIFEPLYTTKQSGTGLGLVSCKTIIEQHGGTVTVRNNPTVFSIILPKKNNYN